MPRKIAKKPTRGTAQNRVRAIPEEVRHDDLDTTQIEDAEWEPEEPPPAGDPTESTDLEAVEGEILPEEISPGTRAVSVSDPLRRYMEEVRRYPLLSPEDEMKLALRLRDTGDIQAAKALVQANLRLVVKIAFEYRSLYTNVLDLIQEGNIGLMKAVSKFDPTKGARLGYYSSWWIRSYILKYLIDNFRLVKIGTTQAQKKLFYHLMREMDRLEAQGFQAGPKLLAEKLDVREKDVVEMQQRLSGQGAELSIDAPIEGSDGQVSHASWIVDPGERADDSLARSELVEMLSSRLPEFRKSLKDKELKILEERLLAEDPKTLQEVADQYGLTRERVRQIEAKVIDKLRAFLAPDLKGKAED